MPILNYTTKIEAFVSVGEIQAQLAKHGAKKVLQDFSEAGRPEALSFVIDTPMGIRAIMLPAKVDEVHKVLLRQKVKCDRLQAERVAWRILKDWVEAQMAILESEMVAMDEVFLPYMVDKSGNTLYQAYCCNQLMLEGSVVV